MKLRYLRPVLPVLTLPLLLTASALCQATGVSHPDQLDDTITASPAQTSHYVMPSRQAASASQATTAPQQPTSDVSYPATGAPPQTSYLATGSASTATSDAQPTPALIVRQPLSATSATGASTATYAPTQTASYQPEPAERPGADDGVVQVRLLPHQLNEGVVLKTRLDQAVSTETTPKGTTFTAQLLTDLGHSGEVLLPAGSILHGRITEIHGGKRISGMAAIRLQAESITLPDGLSYPLHATVSGIQSEEDQHVNSEGAIQPTTHPKETAVALGSVAGAATIMGAAIGGGVGAVVGAGVGAGAGAIWWLKRDHQETIPAGTTLSFSLDEPLQLNPR